jgi:hypothetical protein
MRQGAAIIFASLRWFVRIAIEIANWSHLGYMNTINVRGAQNVHLPL